MNSNNLTVAKSKIYFYPNGSFFLSCKDWRLKIDLALQTFCFHEHYLDAMTLKNWSRIGEIDLKLILVLVLVLALNFYEIDLY